MKNPFGLPYVNPYPTQIELIQKIHDTCANDGVGLLESPTGTGKTLGLLCGVLSVPGIIESNKTIYYCTRTHSQIDQVIKEFARTEFAASVKILALGSRAMLCLNADVGKNTTQDINEQCKSLVEDKACPYYNNFLKEKHSLEFTLTVAGIEELLGLYKQKGSCAYYASHQLISLANVHVLP